MRVSAGKTGDPEKGGDKYRVQPRLVPPWDALWKSLRQHDTHLFFARHGCKHERRLPLIVPADHAPAVDILMALLYEKLSNASEAASGGEVQRSVAMFVPVGVLQVGRVIADDALDEREVVEQDGAAQPSGYVNPRIRLFI